MQFTYSLAAHQSPPREPFSRTQQNTPLLYWVKQANHRATHAELRRPGTRALLAVFPSNWGDLVGSGSQKGLMRRDSGKTQVAALRGKLAETKCARIW